MRDLFVKKLGRISDEELEKFNEWAFGDFKHLETTLQFMRAWNKHHGNKLRLTPDGCISDDVERMVELWKARKTSQ